MHVKTMWIPTLAFVLLGMMTCAAAGGAGAPASARLQEPEPVAHHALDAAEDEGHAALDTAGRAGHDAVGAAGQTGHRAADGAFRTADEARHRADGAAGKAAALADEVSARAGALAGDAVARAGDEADWLGRTAQENVPGTPRCLQPTKTLVAPHCSMAIA